MYATLHTLHGFLNWIPVGYVFENNLIDLVTTKFLPYPVFRSISVKCLTEISSINIDDNPEYANKLVTMIRKVVEVLAEQVPLNIDLAQSYASGTNDDQMFVSNLAQLLATFLREHAKLVELSTKDETKFQGQPIVIIAHQYLLKISEVEDVEVFKVRLLSAATYNE